MDWDKHPGRLQAELGAASARAGLQPWRQRQGRPYRNQTSAWVEQEIKLRPGLWRLHAILNEDQTIIGTCENCKWSETYEGLDGVDRLRCRFNAPECPCEPSTLITDGNMELAGTEAWTANGTTCVLSKGSGGPAPWTGAYLKVLQNAAGPAQVYASKSFAWRLTQGRLAKMTGRYLAPVANTAQPAIGFPQTTTVIAGVKDGAWHDFTIWGLLPAGDFSYYLKLGLGTSAVLGDYAIFADVRIQEIDLNYARWNNVLAEDWCAQWRNVTAVDPRIVWFRINDQVTWLGPVDMLEHPGPIPQLGAGYCEPIPNQDGYRDLFVDQDATLYALIPPFTDLDPILLSEADDPARR